MTRELFPGQDIDEKIYIAVREHPIILIMKILVWLLLVVVLIMFRRYAPESLPQIFEGQTGIIVAIFEQIYLMFLIMALFIIFVIYYLNLYIVTNMRIVDIDQIGLFKHQVSILNIAQIEDVSSETTGILGNLFDFGTINIQTAGAKERFEFNNVPRPARLSKIIIDLFEQQQGHKPGVK